MVENNDKKPLIQVLERAIDILDLLAETRVPMRTTDLAEKLGISQQSAGNLLRTLYGRGMLSQDKERRYRLGPHCFYLGSFADEWIKLREVSRSIVYELREKTGCTVFLGALENDKLFCLSLLWSDEPYMSHPPQEWTDQPHSTACGRLLMALLPQEERRQMLKRIYKRQVTDKTITDPELLEKSCAEIAECGYSEIREESFPGIWSLAVPVTTPTGKILAGLTLSAKIAEREMQSSKFLPLLFDAASRIGRLAMPDRKK